MINKPSKIQLLYSQREDLEQRVKNAYTQITHYKSLKKQISREIKKLKALNND